MFSGWWLVTCVRHKVCSRAWRQLNCARAVHASNQGHYFCALPRSTSLNKTTSRIKHDFKHFFSPLKFFFNKLSKIMVLLHKDLGCFNRKKIEFIIVCSDSVEWWCWWDGCYKYFTFLWPVSAAKFLLYHDMINARYSLIIIFIMFVFTDITAGQVLTINNLVLVASRAFLWCEPLNLLNNSAWKSNWIRHTFKNANSILIRSFLTISLMNDPFKCVQAFNYKMYIIMNRFLSISIHLFVNYLVQPYDKVQRNHRFISFQ